MGFSPTPQFISRLSILLTIFLALFSTAHIPTAVATDPSVEWTSDYHDAQHTGFSSGSAPATPSQITNISTGATLPTSFLIATANNLFVQLGESNPQIFSIDVRTGSTVRIYSVDAAGQPAKLGGVTNRDMYLSTEYNNSIIAIDLSTGATAWRFQSGGRISAPPTVTESLVFANSFDGNLYVLSATTGSTVWTAIGIMKSSSNPVAYDGRIVVALSYVDGKAYGLNGMDGAVIWSFTASSMISSAPSISDGRVFFGDNGGKVYALNTSTGTLLWNYQTGGTGTNHYPPAVAYGLVYVPEWDGKLYVLDEGTGASKWTYTGGPLPYPALGSRRAYVSSNGMIAVLDAMSGSQLWDLSLSTTGYPIIANSRVYVGTGTGVVVAVGSSSGSSSATPFTLLSAASAATSAMMLYTRRKGVNSSGRRRSM